VCITTTNAHNRSHLPPAAAYKLLQDAADKIPSPTYGREHTALMPSTKTPTKAATAARVHKRTSCHTKTATAGTFMPNGLRCRVLFLTSFYLSPPGTKGSPTFPLDHYLHPPAPIPAARSSFWPTSSSSIPTFPKSTSNKHRRYATQITRFCTLNRASRGRSWRQRSQPGQCHPGQFHQR
jgi:hypothetical protein